jgi:hypothetical protein
MITLMVYGGRLIDLLVQQCRRVKLAELEEWVRCWLETLVLHMCIHTVVKTRSREGVTMVIWSCCLRQLKLRLVLAVEIELSLARIFAPAKYEEWYSSLDLLISPEHIGPRFRQIGAPIPWLIFGKCVVVFEGFQENMNLNYSYMNFNTICQTGVVVPCD